MAALPTAASKKRTIFRRKVRSVPCPKCKATEQWQCIQPDGTRRQANHIERIEAWKLATGEDVTYAWRRPKRTA